MTNNLRQQPRVALRRAFLLGATFPPPASAAAAHEYLSRASVALAPHVSARREDKREIVHDDENARRPRGEISAAACAPKRQSSAMSDSVAASGDQEATAGGRTPDYEKLIACGLDSKVAETLDDIYKTGKLDHSNLDDRALDALKEFPSEGAIAVLNQFLESNLEHVSNKSAYLCGVMKTYRQKTRQAAEARSGGGSGSGGGGSLPSGTGSSVTNGAAAPKCGPNEDKIKEILERTGFSLDVTTGQRKFGGPPPGWEGDPPSNGCEVFCGKIPRDLYEDELIPLFEKCGPIWDLRLMMDPMTGLNRGYAFVTFATRDAASEAVKQLDQYELGGNGSGKALKVNISEPKTRLFIGNIPKSKDRLEIEDEFENLTAGLREVIIYSSPDDKKKNRGFCFLEYESHKAASLAKRRLETGRVKVWSCDIIVDWADPQEEPDDSTMSTVKVLYVRNLTVSVTEESLREKFESFGKVERVKKIKDYAFVHFEDREQATEAMRNLNGQDMEGSPLEISLAKPPSDKKKKEEMLRKREQRMMKTMANSMAFVPFSPFPQPYGPMGPAAAMYGPPRGGGGRVGMPRAGMPRGFENHAGWNAWGWADGGGWAAHPGQHRGGLGVGWMGGASDGWGYPPAGSGRGQPWGNNGHFGGGGGAGNGSIGGSNHSPSGGGGGAMVAAGGNSSSGSAAGAAAASGQNRRNNQRQGFSR